MKSLNNRIDATLQTVLNRTGGPYFTKAEIVSKVRDTNKFADVFQRLRQIQGWDLDKVLEKYIEGRLTKIVQQTETVEISDGAKVEIRVYESYYASESREYRWQKRNDLTADELRVCLAARRRQVAGDQRAIRVYERLLEILERSEQSGQSEPVTVGSIWDEALRELTAADL